MMPLVQKILCFDTILFSIILLDLCAKEYYDYLSSCIKLVLIV